MRNEFTENLITELLRKNYDEESFGTVVRKVVELTAEAAIDEVSAAEGQRLREYFGLL